MGCCTSKGRVADDRAGKAQPMALAAGEPQPLLPRSASPPLGASPHAASRLAVQDISDDDAAPTEQAPTRSTPPALVNMAQREKLLSSLLLRSLEPTQNKADIAAAIDREFGREAAIAIVSLCAAAEITRDEGLAHSCGLVMCMRELSARCLAACRGALVKHEGALIFAVFDKPEDALRYAVMLQSVMPAFNAASLRPEDTIELQIGVDCGRCLLLPGDVYGDPVNVAAKLAEELGARNQILCSDAVHRRAVGAAGAGAGFGPQAFEGSSVHVSGVRLDYYLVLWDVLRAALPAAPRMPAGPRQALSLAGSTFARLCLDRLASDDEADRGRCAEAIRKMFRKRGVVFVSDMSGFTRISQAQGIQHFLALVYKMRAIMRECFAQHGGLVVRTQGDDFKCMFDSNDAAVRCSVEILQALAAFNDRVTDVSLNGLNVCIGLAGGEVIFVPEEHNFFGDPAERAFALGEELGSAGELLVSHETMADLSFATQQLIARVAVVEDDLHGSAGGVALRFCRIRLV